MKPLFDHDSFLNSPKGSKLLLECYNCKKAFEQARGVIAREMRDKRGRLKFCSTKCSDKFKETSISKNCAHCNKSLIISFSLVKKSKTGNFFCNLSCAATYNNTHKTKGTRKSKLENWIEQQLKIKYPNLEIYFNHKDAINSELDIYILSLQLAFELNGIFHYEPIYGSDKLMQIQNNDERKFQACLENNIELCIIDVSNQKRFTEKSSQKYLDIITNIVDVKLRR